MGGVGWRRVWIGEERLTGGYRKKIRKYIMENQISMYCREKERKWCQERSEEVLEDTEVRSSCERKWEVYRRALGSESKRIGGVKLVKVWFGWGATEKRLAKWKNEHEREELRVHTSEWERRRREGKCKVCGEDVVEDGWHVTYECYTEEMVEYRRRWLNELDTVIDEGGSEQEGGGREWREWIQKQYRRGRLGSEVRHNATEEREFWRGLVVDRDRGKAGWKERRKKLVTEARKVMERWWKMWKRRCVIKSKRKEEELEKEMNLRREMIIAGGELCMNKIKNWSISKLRVASGEGLVG